MSTVEHVVVLVTLTGIVQEDTKCVGETMAVKRGR